VVFFKRYSIPEVADGVWKLAGSQADGAEALSHQGVGCRTVQPNSGWDGLICGDALCQ
jgi:hypothetical protein